MAGPAASIECRAHGAAGACATPARPRPIRASVLATGCALLLSLGGCQRADADYQSCAGAAAGPAQAHQPVAPDVRHCMEARGWRLLRPSLPPGSNAWARIQPASDALAHRPPLPEPGDRRPH